MSSRELRRTLADLRRQVEVLRPAFREADYLREYFGAPEFDGQREQIVAGLLSPRAQYSFEQQEEGDMAGYPSHYALCWWDRSQPPVCIQMCRGRQ
jgi:hypothetical protein